MRRAPPSGSGLLNSLKAFPSLDEISRKLDLGEKLADEVVYENPGLSPLTDGHVRHLLSSPHASVASWFPPTRHECGVVVTSQNWNYISKSLAQMSLAAIERRENKLKEAEVNPATLTAETRWSCAARTEACLALLVTNAPPNELYALCTGLDPSAPKQFSDVAPRLLRLRKFWPCVLYFLEDATGDWTAEGCRTSLPRVIPLWNSLLEGSVLANIIFLDLGDFPLFTFDLLASRLPDVDPRDPRERLRALVVEATATERASAASRLLQRMLVLLCVPAAVYLRTATMAAVILNYPTGSSLIATPQGLLLVAILICLAEADVETLYSRSALGIFSLITDDTTPSSCQEALAGLATLQSGLARFDGRLADSWQAAVHSFVQFASLRD